MNVNGTVSKDQIVVAEESASYFSTYTVVDGIGGKSEDDFYNSSKCR